jgi:transmembrane sensor
MSVENYKELFFKYLKNECTVQELSSILSWMQDSSNAEQVKSLITDDWERFNIDGEDRSRIDVSFESLKRRLSQGITVDLDSYSSHIQNKYRIRKLIIRIAASFVLPVVLGMLTYFLLHIKERDGLQVINEISVPLGSKTVVLLGDGTKIWLNSGSSLKYPQKFQGNSREVVLSGEAFFDVKKDARKPFIVKTSALNIKVLGTTFNVKSYPEEGTIETTLVNGAVTITKSNTDLKCKDAIFLKPNQRATYIKEEGKLILADIEKKVVKAEPIIEVGQKRKEKMILSNNIDIVPFTAWKDDKLVFKNEEFESLCTKLERWYNVKINIDDPELKKYHYTGILQKETINDVIEIIRLTMPFQYDVNHSVIDIWGLGHKKPELYCQ